MAHPPAFCRRRGARHRHYAPGWLILRRSVGGGALDTATTALDGASSRVLSEAGRPIPPLRPWMAHPPAFCRRRGARHRHYGPGWRILPRSVGGGAPGTATTPLDGASSRVLSEAGRSTPPLRPWMAHPPAFCRRRGAQHRHYGHGWRILPRSVGGGAPNTATTAMDGASSRVLSEAGRWTPPLRPWMAHPLAFCRRRGARYRHYGPGWRILLRSVGAGASRPRLRVGPSGRGSSQPCFFPTAKARATRSPTP
jgi:hypothetical protein